MISPDRAPPRRPPGSCTDRRPLWAAHVLPWVTVLGDRVILCWAPANRDPAVFSDPDSVDIDRPNASRHLSFGVRRPPLPWLRAGPTDRRAHDPLGAGQPPRLQGRRRKPGAVLVAGLRGRLVEGPGRPSRFSSRSRRWVIVVPRVIESCSLLRSWREGGWHSLKAEHQSDIRVGGGGVGVDDIVR